MLVSGMPGPDKTTAARQLAAELRIPLFSQDVIAPNVADPLWALLRDSPVDGVVESWFGPDNALLVVEGLQRCGLDRLRPLSSGAARRRSEASALPLGLGLGPTVAFYSGQGAPRADVVRTALVGAGLVPASET